MLEIIGEHISELNDSDLRALIGMLCEAELRSQKTPAAGVTWGGHQNTKDGGIDVRVSITTKPKKDCYIPLPDTCFQVKQSGMPASSISKEMCPDGKLRESIQELARIGGAYIIASGRDSTTNTALTDRREAMRSALSELNNASSLKTDFYDRERIASWVRHHTSLALWVREKIGNPIQGWQSYGNWARTSGGVDEEYILDDELRLHNNTHRKSKSLTAVEGINELRSKLAQPGSSFRLIGLSGVGKTRLVQALFDERVGEKSLNKFQVYYTDVGDNPIPAPRRFVEQLMAHKNPATLVIDNCPPELHRQLTSLCTASGSLISLLTIEYDVKEDQPEESEVFRLEPASQDLIEKVILNRFEHINGKKAERIAEFSGGNARIALALANTIRKRDSIADIKDEVLFERLFHQGNHPNDRLLRSAEVCSLVYSFDYRYGKDSSGELEVLSDLANKPVRELYEDIAELKRRVLVQERNYWRAILPHAIANKLAKRALENIPLEIIIDSFMQKGPERLLKSFSKRLGYLHESEKANETLEQWLAGNGPLHDLTNLTELDMVLLRNIAPVNPRAILEALERAVNSDDNPKFATRENKHFREITRLLRQLAYDPELFEKSVDLLSRFALSEDKDENRDSIRRLLDSLFYIHLSGTHATPEQRLKVIKELVYAKSRQKQELGLTLLRAALEATHFTSSYLIDFGSRPRDYGYRPETQEDVIQWYSTFIEFTLHLALSDHPLSVDAKNMLGKQFQSLWRQGLFKSLENAAEKLHKKGTWQEGWLSVRATIRTEGEKMTPDSLARLRTLDRLLRPTDLEQQARAFALADHGQAIDLVDAAEKDDRGKASGRYKRVRQKTRTIGKQVAVENEVLSNILPELVSTNSTRTFKFGQGLAEGCNSPLVLWENFRTALQPVEERKRNFKVICGFLNGLQEKNPGICNTILDEALTDEVFSSVFPVLQTSVKIDKQGVRRIRHSLNSESAPIHLYTQIAYGQIHQTINDPELSDILKVIAGKPEGMPVAIEILQMRYHGLPDDHQSLSETIISAGQNLITQIELDSGQNWIRNIDFSLAQIVKTCLAGNSGKEAATTLCNNLADALIDYDIYTPDFDETLEALAQTKPRIFLDCFLGGTQADNALIPRLFSQDLDITPKPISNIENDIIIDWCTEEPHKRYLVVASSIIPFERAGGQKLQWTELALQLIDNASDPIQVLDRLRLALRPMSWSGSRAEIMQNRLSLISVLKEHENLAVSEWAETAEIEFENEIESERKNEKDWDRQRNTEMGFE